MNADKLKEILADHKVWVESGATRGKRADLLNANLTRATLNGAILHGVGLIHADLTGAHFEIEFKSVNNFRNAIFSESAIPWVILNPQWSELADSVKFV